MNKLEQLLFADPVYQQHKCTHKCVAGDGEARCKRHPEDNLYGNFAEHTWKVVKKENGQGKKKYMVRRLLLKASMLYRYSM